MHFMLSFLWTVFAAGVGAYIGGYLGEKGKNRATSEDIDKLTRIVEDIKAENAGKLADIQHQNSLLLEQMKSQHQLRVAALDKRLQAHQEAYAHWRQLIHAMQTGKEFNKTVLECQSWWEHNCLYLEAEPRQAFHRSYMTALQVRQRYGRGADTLPPAVYKLSMEFEQQIYECGDTLVKAAKLPELAARGEAERVEEDALTDTR
jgi:hypothetical protein